MSHIRLPWSKNLINQLGSYKIITIWTASALGQYITCCRIIECLAIRLIACMQDVYSCMFTLLQLAFTSLKLGRSWFPLLQSWNSCVLQIRAAQMRRGPGATGKQWPHGSQYWLGSTQSRQSRALLDVKLDVRTAALGKKRTSLWQVSMLWCNLQWICSDLLIWVLWLACFYKTWKGWRVWYYTRFKWRCLSIQWVTT